MRLTYHTNKELRYDEPSSYLSHFMDDSSARHLDRHVAKLGQQSSQSQLRRALGASGVSGTLIQVL